MVNNDKKTKKIKKVNNKKVKSSKPKGKKPVSKNLRMYCFDKISMGTLASEGKYGFIIKHM